VVDFRGALALEGKATFTENHGFPAKPSDEQGPPMISTYAPLFLMIAVASLLAGLFFTGATFLGGKVNKTREKMLPFECGSESSGGRHLKLSVKFYLTAILFVVFDIEAVFIYPWAIQFKALGWTGLGSMFGFLAVVVVALVYVVKKGALEWEN
jgi:NADH-quinone oxidoreductase subunit A